ncbi:hypothetical protein SCHPADRAFT_934689 [Schizopora paradoxa]|uniref:DUF6593 domain-containing protein n=1 Tax=Schizopora paradoxa TaxID=27342 RepID=A0A0H2S785_9AGAM|nr:hypothetical protein SCHPADRAFT_934689 [Schizopora paradoxa]
MQTTTTNPSLVLSYDDVTSTTLDCEELGLHYQVSTQSNFLGNAKTTQIRRRDTQSGKTDLIAQWERHTLQPDLFKFTGAGTSNPRVTSFLGQKSGCAPWERSFVGDDGRRYTWSEESLQLVARVIEDHSRGEPVAIFHERNVAQSRNACLELLPGHEGTLDSLLVTFIYVEWKRRQTSDHQLRKSQEFQEKQVLQGNLQVLLNQQTAWQSNIATTSAAQTSTGMFSGGYPF